MEKLTYMCIRISKKGICEIKKKNQMQSFCSVQWLERTYMFTYQQRNFKEKSLWNSKKFWNAIILFCSMARNLPFSFILHLLSLRSRVLILILKNLLLTRITIYFWIKCNHCELIASTLPDHNGHTLKTGRYWSPVSH